MKLDYGVERKARIEMLPLIDIVFLLLVVFIYTMLSMSVHRGLEVCLPASSYLAACASHYADSQKSFVLIAVNMPSASDCS